MLENTMLLGYSVGQEINLDVPLPLPVFASLQMPVLSDLKIKNSRNLVCLAAFLIKIVTSCHVLAQDVFPDKALEKAIRWEVFEKRYNDQPITVEDVKSISQVVARGKGIKSLEGLQHCKAIMKIDLANNEISDLAPIADLKLIQSLDLSGNQIANLDSLKNLVQMQYLQLSKNQVKDLTPVAGMQKLNALYVNENQVSNIQPCFGLKKLWTLQLAGNPIESIQDISELKHLRTLNLRNCKLKRVDFLASLNELNLLMLDQNPLETLMPLVTSCESGAAKQHSQFLRLYLDQDHLKNLASEVDRLKATNVKINPETK
jgi:Leucine-rich repeat (LRR) protein